MVNHNITSKVLFSIYIKLPLKFDMSFFFIYKHWVRLKELSTSISILAQKLILTPAPLH